MIQPDWIPKSKPNRTPEFSIVRQRVQSFSVLVNITQSGSSLLSLHSRNSTIARHSPCKLFFINEPGKQFAVLLHVNQIFTNDSISTISKIIQWYLRSIIHSSFDSFFVPNCSVPPFLNHTKSKSSSYTIWILNSQFDLLYILHVWFYHRHAGSGG